MKIPQLIILLFVVLLFVLSVLVAEIAFRTERTLLSYGFTYRELQSLLAPLDDPEVHATTISEAFRFVRRDLDFAVPRELEPYILNAAVNGFSASWIGQTAGIWLVTAQQALHGNRDTLEFPLSLSPFKSSFLSAIRGEFTMAEQLEINEAIDDIPSTIDLADQLPEKLRDRLIAVGRSMGLTQVLLQYVVPGILIIACFFHRRIGTGLAAVGIGLLVAGVPSVVVTAVRSSQVAAGVTRRAAGSLPDFADWMAEGIQSTVAVVIESGVATAVSVLVSGALLLALGLYLAIVRGDPRLHVGGR